MHAPATKPSANPLRVKSPLCPKLDAKTHSVPPGLYRTRTDLDLIEQLELGIKVSLLSIHERRLATIPHSRRLGHKHPRCCRRRAGRHKDILMISVALQHGSYGRLCCWLLIQSSSSVQVLMSTFSIVTTALPALLRNSSVPTSAPRVP